MQRTKRFYQVRSNSVLIYELPIERHGRRHTLTPALTPTYSGAVTPHARRRLMCALDVLVQRSPTKQVWSPKSGEWYDYKLSFITLTIADQKNVSVATAYEKLLREWLRYMKRKQGLKDYVWKAEYQRRGQVHYHVGTNCYIPWETVRWRWNQLQYRAGMLDDFARRYKHTNPNSTDVHSMRNVADCYAYIGKEMCKGVQNQKTTKGKIWDCSTELKKGRFSAAANWELYDNIDDALQFGFATKEESEHCTIIKCRDPTLIIPKSDLADYDKHIFA